MASGYILAFPFGTLDVSTFAASDNAKVTFCNSLCIILFFWEIASLFRYFSTIKGACGFRVKSPLALLGFHMISFWGFRESWSLIDMGGAPTLIYFPLCFSFLPFLYPSQMFVMCIWCLWTWELQLKGFGLTHSCMRVRFC